MLFHLFCEFADGSSRYLHLKTSTMKDAYRQAKRDHYAIQVLWIISSIDPFCRTLGLEYTPFKDTETETHRDGEGEHNRRASEEMETPIAHNLRNLSLSMALKSK
jgi:hypothetical protein